MTRDLQAIIDSAWAEREKIGPKTRGPVRDAVDAALALLDTGSERVASPRRRRVAGAAVAEKSGAAVLSSQRLGADRGRPGRRLLVRQGATEVPGLGCRALSRARASALCRDASSGTLPSLLPGVVLMPCFLNVGAYVDEGSMIDTWATVGSCAQIGKRCHISGGAGIGGVLEPLQADPVIIEDDCFIGARAEVAEGVRIGRGSVLSMGVYLGASTRIIDRMTGEVRYGTVPPYSVVVSGTMTGRPLPDGSPGPGLYCAVIVKRVDEKTRAKTSINELLRD